LLAVLRFRSRHHRDGRRHLGFRRWRARHTALAAVTPRSRATPPRSSRTMPTATTMRTRRNSTSSFRRGRRRKSRANQRNL